MASVRRQQAAAVALASALCFAGATHAQALRTITQDKPQAMPGQVPPVTAEPAIKPTPVARPKKGAPPPKTPAKKVSPDAPLDPAYLKAMRGAILQNWTRPAASKAGTHCMIQIEQTKDGRIGRSRFGEPCDFDLEARRALKAAVDKSSPLPYRGFEAVWRPSVNILFEPVTR